MLLPTEQPGKDLRVVQHCTHLGAVVNAVASELPNLLYRQSVLQTAFPLLKYKVLGNLHLTVDEQR